MMADGSIATAVSDRTVPIAPEDAMRAQMYDLLAALLRAAPDAAMLDALSRLEGDDAGTNDAGGDDGDTDIGRAVGALARIAAATDEARARREYHDLFVGIGRGELVPYGSYYLTGFLNEKPLGELRREMRARGLARAESVREPEDHIASLMEMMASLIEGRHGAPASVASQASFFSAHVEPWAVHFFKDLEAAEGAVLYAPVGTIGRALMGVEADAFAMDGSARG